MEGAELDRIGRQVLIRKKMRRRSHDLLDIESLNDDLRP